MSNTNEQPEGRTPPPGSFLKNPAAYFAEWSSANKCFSYYDKETKKKVLIPLPFTFIVVDKLVTVKGYNEPENTGYDSNEVYNPKKEEFIVRARNNYTKKTTIYIRGLWENIKEKCNAVDAAWTESVYIGVKDEKGELILANLQLNGSGMTHWFDFLKSNDIWSTAVQVNGFSNEKKGTNNYVAPIFETIKISKETNDKATALQKHLRAYLSTYFAKDHADISQDSQKEEKRGNNEAKHEAEIAGDKNPITTSDPDLDNLPF